MQAPLIEPDGSNIYHIVPTHFNLHNVLDSICEPSDASLVNAIEQLTNDCSKAQHGDVRKISPQECLSELTAAPIMASFSHIGQASHFSSGDFGLYYGAKDLETAISESLVRRETFLSATNEADTELTMQEQINQIALTMHDIRAERFKHLIDSQDLTQAREFAKKLRSQHSNGLVYPSIHHSGGECIAAFRPKAVTPPIKGQTFRYVWSNKQQKIVQVFAVTSVNISR